MRLATLVAAEGITIGDIIVGFDGKEIDKEADLFKALEGRKVGDTVTLTVSRSTVSERKVRVRAKRAELETSS